MRFWLAQWLVLTAFWLLFTWSLAPAELIFGVVSAAAAAAASHVVWREHLAPFSARPRWLAQVAGLARLVVVETGTIFKVLFRQVVLGEPAPSLVRAVRFDVGGDDPASGTRRALAIAFTTAAPNSIVIGVDRATGLMLFHQLEATDLPPMTLHLGARP